MIRISCHYLTKYFQASITSSTLGSPASPVLILANTMSYIPASITR